MIKILIDVSELVRLADAVPVLSRSLDEELRHAMDESGMLLSGMAAARTPVNYGLLRGSIQWPNGYELQGSVLDILRGIVGARDMPSMSGVSTSTYVEYVEEGTRAHWAPIAPLKLWAIRKFGDERIAYAVQRKIAASGTEGAHMFRRAWDEGGRRRVEEFFQRAPVRALDRFEAAA